MYCLQKAVLVPVRALAEYPSHLTPIDDLATEYAVLIHGKRLDRRYGFVQPTRVDICSDGCDDRRCLVS